MKKPITFLCLMWCLFSLSSQNNADNQPLQDWKFNLGAGFDFAAGKDFTGNTLFITPTLSKQFSNKLTIYAGTLFQSYSFLSTGKHESGLYMPLQTLSVFGAAAFQVNEKVTIYGGLIHSEPVSIKQGQLMNKSGDAIFGGIDYSISRNSKIGLRFMYGSDYFPLYSYPATFRNDQSGFLFPFHDR
jgi:hypothetical protein